jgi:hypothetical protein
MFQDLILGKGVKQERRILRTVSKVLCSVLPDGDIYTPDTSKWVEAQTLVYCGFDDEHFFNQRLFEKHAGYLATLICRYMQDSEIKKECVRIIESTFRFDASIRQLLKEKEEV